MSGTDPAWTPPPAPVQALPYSLAAASRPGIVTAIGVLCITIACLSAISSFVGAMYSVGFYLATRVQAQMATMSASFASAAANASSTTAPTASAALSGGEAAVAVNTLDSILSLDPPHLSELDRLMRRHGREVFGGDEDKPITAADVREEVLTSTKQRGSPGAAEFSTAQGTVRILADRAEFTSADGSETVRTSARRKSDQVTHGLSNNPAAGAAAAGGSAPSTTLTPTQVNQVITSAQTMGTSINGPQLQSLRAELSKPNQALVTPASPMPVTSVTTQPDGNLALVFDTGNMLILGQQGKVISSGPVPMPNFGISGAMATVTALEGLASAALAVYLLIVGIMVFRGSFYCPRMLRIYAFIKIPLALVAGTGLATFGYAISKAVMSSPAAGMSGASIDSLRTGFVLGGVTATLLGLAFPIGILLALRSRSVSNYFNSVVSSI